MPPGSIPQPGILRSQIELQSLLRTEDDFHQPISSPLSIQTGVWAKVVSISSQEITIGQKRITRTRYGIWIRYRPTWTATQCVWNGKIIGFDGNPIDIDGLHEYFYLEGVCDG